MDLLDIDGGIPGQEIEHFFYLKRFVFAILGVLLIGKQNDIRVWSWFRICSLIDFRNILPFSKSANLVL